MEIVNVLAVLEEAKLLDPFPEVVLGHLPVNVENVYRFVRRHVEPSLSARQVTRHRKNEERLTAFSLGKENVTSTSSKDRFAEPVVVDSLGFVERRPVDESALERVIALE